MKWYQKIHHIKIEKKIVIMFVAIAVAGILVSSVIMGYFLDKTRNKTYNEIAHNLDLIMQEKHHALETVAYTNMLSIASNPELVDALKRGDRQKAIGLLALVEKNLESNTQFDTFKVHLHTREGHAFLRSWKPDKYGDDLTTFRHTIPYIVKHHTPFVTTEVGKTGMTIRGIVPMFDSERQYVGSAEFILSFDSFIDWMKKNGNADLLVLMDKKYQIRAKPEDIHLGHYVLSQKKYNPDFLEAAKKLDIDAIAQKPWFSDDHYLYTLVPIYDFAKKKIGWYMIGKDMRDVNAIVKDAEMMIYTSLAMIALLLLVTTALSVAVIRKLVLKPLERFQEGLMRFFEYYHDHDKSLTLRPIDVVYDDEIGTMAHSVNKQIEAMEASIQNEECVIAESSRVIEKTGEGDLTHRIAARSKNATLQQMIDLLNGLFENLESNIGKDVNRIADTLEAYAHCNYTYAIPDATGRVEKQINRMQEVITQMLIQSVKSSEALQGSAASLSQNVVVLNQSASQQFESIENTFTIMTQINETMQQNMQKLQAIGRQIDIVTGSLHEGEYLSDKTGESMRSIDTQVEEIKQAITVIDEISFQTNILSLNAAVEAATAGDAGKGFAVVAQEVRNLAAKSADAAKSIEEKVANATEMTQAGKEATEKMLEGYRHLKEKITETTQEIEQISATIQAQHRYIEEIHIAMQSIRENAQNNRQIAHTTEAIAEATSTLSTEIVTQSRKSRYDKRMVSAQGCTIEG